jgi:hypothetical protein
LLQKSKLTDVKHFLLVAKCFNLYPCMFFPIAFRISCYLYWMKVILLNIYEAFILYVDIWINIDHVSLVPHFNRVFEPLDLAKC